MTRKHGIIVAAVVGIVLLVGGTGLKSVLHGQTGSAKPKDADKPKDAAKPGAKRAEFDGLFAEWKKLVGDIRRLQGEAKTAPAEKAPAIEKDIAERIRRAQAMQPKLTAAAEAAYIEAPDAAKDAGQFLLAVVLQDWQNDNYEESLRTAKVLLDHGFDDKLVYVPAGWSAFCTTDFPMAAKYLQMAKETGAVQTFGPEIAEWGSQFLKDIPFYEQAWKHEQELRAAESKADDLPRVLLKTTKGDIEIELFENEAPNTVANFIALVEKKFYDGSPFHRVLPQFMAQGGGPKGTGADGPGYTIPDEFNGRNYRVHFRGSLSMANTGQPNTGDSQFFLTFRPTHHLDGKHTAFGRVIKGIEVLSKLQRIDPQRPDPRVKPDTIVQATVVRKRPHPYEPKTLKGKG